MKKELVKLLKKRGFRNKPIMCWSNNIHTYETLKILRNNQLDDVCIISDNYDVQKKKQIYGIPFYTFEQALWLYGKEGNLLIDRNEYFVFKKYLFEKGYKVNKNLYVDNKINYSLYLFEKIYFLYKLPQNIIDTVKKLIKKAEIFQEYINEFKIILRGRNIYNRLKSDNDETILVYDYTGLGDVFIFCGLLKGNEDKVFDGNFRLVVIGNACKRVAQMFNLTNVCALSENDSIALMHFAKFSGGKYHILSITPFSRVMYTEKISGSMAGIKINMLDMYKYVFFKLPADAKFYYPQIAAVDKDIAELFEQQNLRKGKTVILAPYANTVIGYPQTFWIELADRLTEEGYDVCTNCNGTEKEIIGTKRLEFKLEIAERVIDYAGYFIGLRSGFCDIICNSSARKVILYPIYYIFNSDLYEFCSLKKMGVGKNYIEIQWKYDKFEELKNIIINNLVSRRK